MIKISPRKARKEEKKEIKKQLEKDGLTDYCNRIKSLHLVKAGYNKINTKKGEILYTSGLWTCFGFYAYIENTETPFASLSHVVDAKNARVDGKRVAAYEVDALWSIIESNPELHKEKFHIGLVYGDEHEEHAHRCNLRLMEERILFLQSIMEQNNIQVVRNMDYVGRGVIIDCKEPRLVLCKRGRTKNSSII